MDYEDETTPILDLDPTRRQVYLDEVADPMSNFNRFLLCFGLYHLVDMIVSIYLLFLAIHNYGDFPGCEHNLEAWMIVNGALAMLLVPLSCIQSIVKLQRGEMVHKLFIKLFALLLSFRLLWVFIGAVWVFGLGWVVMHCNPLIMDWSFGYILVSWTFTFFFLSWATVLSMSLIKNHVDFQSIIDAVTPKLNSK